MRRGRPVAMLAFRRAKSSGVSWRTSVIGWPTAAWNGGAVERQDPLRDVGGGEAARQAVDDVLVESLQVGDLGRGLYEALARRSHAFGQRAAQPRDRKESKR